MKRFAAGNAVVRHAPQNLRPARRPPAACCSPKTNRPCTSVASRFARERLRPGYQQREHENGIDRALCREMGGLGLVGIDLPEAFGGMGQSGVTAGLIVEAIAYGDFNVSYVQLLASLMGQIVARNASAELARAWVPKLVAGEAICALGLTEPRGGSDAANLALRARRDGDGYVLDGEKASISFGDQADVVVVFARTGAAERGARAASPRSWFRSMRRGIQRTRYADLGSKLVGRGSLFFDGVRVPLDAPDRRRGQGLHAGDAGLRLQPRPDRAAVHRRGAGLDRRDLGLRAGAQDLRPAARRSTRA